MRRGFTLVEILIVVVILGVLAAVVVPQFASASDDSKIGAFVSSIRSLEEGLEMHHARTGQMVADSSSGNFPPELAGIIRESEWRRGPSIGGEWDVESGAGGIVTYGVGVHFSGGGDWANDTAMTRIDAVLDDGDVETGAFRRIAGGRYYLVLQP